MKPLIFKDTRGNGYLYSPLKKKISYINEILYLIIKSYLEDAGFAIAEEWIEKYGEESVRKNIGRLSFLHEHKFLEESKDDFSTDLKPSYLPDSLSEVKQVCFELTQKCNLSCVYCCYGDLYHHEGNDHAQELDLKMAFCLIDHLCKDLRKKEMGSIKKKIILGFYGGEPLLKYDLIKQIVEYSEERSKEGDDFYFEYIMTTNGILLDRYIDFFVKHKFSLMVSLDGNYENSAYRITKSKENMFNKIDGNLKLLKSKYPEYFNKHVTFNSVIHDKNSVKEVVKFYQEEYNKIPQLAEVAPDPIKEEKRKEFEAMYREVGGNYQTLRSVISKEGYIQLDKAMKNIPHFFYKLLNINIKNWTEWLCDFEYERYPTGICLPFTNKIFVSADGRLHLCEHIGYGYSFGHIDLARHTLVYEKEKVAEDYSSYYKQMSSECSQCAELIVCDTCIFQKRMKCKAVSEQEFAEKIALNMDILRERDFFVKYS